MASEKPPAAEAQATEEEGAGGEENGDLTQFVEKLLGDMQTKFQQMSEQIIGRLDDMGKRVDDLEKNINDLMQQVESREEASAKK